MNRRTALLAAGWLAAGCPVTGCGAVPLRDPAARAAGTAPPPTAGTASGAATTIGTGVTTARGTSARTPRAGTPSPARTPTGARSRTTAHRGAPQDVVWIRTPVIVHDKDFHDLGDYVNPAVGSNWRTPVNYADGDITVRIEIVGTHDPSAVPVYYLVGWGPGDGGDGYIRGGAVFAAASGVVQERVPVKTFQRVVGGVDAGDVGNRWNWADAVGRPNGDVWAGAGGAGLYPIKVRVTVTLHPAR